MAHPISAERYVRLVSFKPDGTAMATPVWIADLGDGTVGFTTALDSWKVKRIRADPQVTVEPCDMKGQPAPDADVYEGTAAVVTGESADRVRSAIKAKYGYQVTLIAALDRLRRLVGKSAQTRAGVIITLD